MGNGRNESKVYSFDDPLEYAGDWKNANPLAKLTPGDLKVRSGCSVFLSYDSQNKTYSGATDAKQCISQLRGATYATSIVTVYQDRIESWDQGFDASGKQVWGGDQSWLCVR